MQYEGESEKDEIWAKRKREAFICDVGLEDDFRQKNGQVQRSWGRNQLGMSMKEGEAGQRGGCE